MSGAIPQDQPSHTPGANQPTSPGRAPFAALDDILNKTRCLLISFDGPVCSLFADMAASRVADSLREVIAQEGVRVPQAIEHTDNWLEILSYAASVSPDLAAHVESELTAMETSAVSAATPTPYTDEVLAACRDSARPVAIVSNHSAAAVHGYLALHDLYGLIGFVAARTGADRVALKPLLSSIELAVTGLEAQSSACALVGDTVMNIQAAQATGVQSIGYARTPRDADHLSNAGAGATIASMADLALRLRAHPFGDPKDPV
jgi:phosphoglycolate phosphatase